MVKHSFCLTVLLCLALFAGGCGSGESDFRATEDPAGDEKLEPIPPIPYDTGSVETLLAGEPIESHPRILELVDEMLAEALVGVPNGADDRTIALHLNWYAHTHIFNADIAPFSILSMLEERTAVCGGTSVALQLLARRMGFETRTGGLYGVPIQASHVIAEIKWDGEWHFFDPTFGVFATSDGSLDGKIISFDTLLKFRHQVAPNVFYAKSDGRLGRDYLSPKPGTLGELYSKTQVTLVSGGTYELFLAETKSASIFDTFRKMTFPYHVDLSRTDEYDIGTRDGSRDDVALHEYEWGNHLYDAHGLQFMGRVGGVTGPLLVEHDYVVSGLNIQDRLVWRTELFVGEPASLKIDARKATIDQITVSGKKVVVQFHALRNEVQFRVSSTDATVKFFDYHLFERL